MGKGYNFEQLKAEMIARSSDQVWEQAKMEWDLRDVFVVNQDQICLCGHHPIRQICTIRNQINQNDAEVGNVCVQKFLGMRSRRILATLKKVRENPEKSLSKAGIAMFTKLGIISQIDSEDYLSFSLKRKYLTPRQRQLKERLNQAVLEYADERARQSENNFRNL